MKKFLSITNKSFDELGVASYKELWEKAQGDGYRGISVCLHSEFTKAADSENKFHAVFSSANEDRHRDVVKQEFDIRAFKKNPVFLDSHNYWSIEAIIGKVVGIGVKDGKLQGDIEFAMANPRGVLAADLAAGGYLGATSIGFIPREFDDEGTILKSELLEVSAVSVPANADALIERSVKGMEDQEEDETPAEGGETPPQEPEAPEPEETPAPEPKAAQKPKMSARQRLAKVTGEMVQTDRKTLTSLAKAVHELTDENRQSKKREIHKTIRRLLNE